MVRALSCMATGVCSQGTVEVLPAHKEKAVTSCGWWINSGEQGSSYRMAAVHRPREQLVQEETEEWKFLWAKSLRKRGHRIDVLSRDIRKKKSKDEEKERQLEISIKTKSSMERYGSNMKQLLKDFKKKQIGGFLSGSVV